MKIIFWPYNIYPYAVTVIHQLWPSCCWCVCLHIYVKWSILKTSGGTGTGINLNGKMNSETFTDSEAFLSFTLCLTRLIQHALQSLFYSLLYFCTLPHVLHNCKCNSTNILSNVFGIIPAFLTQFALFFLPIYTFFNFFLLYFVQQHKTNLARLLNYIHFESVINAPGQLFFNSNI